MKNIAILGSTGSIGRSALSVVDAHPARLRVVALAARASADQLAEQVRRYRPEIVAMGDTVTVPAGTFDDTIEMLETTPLEPGATSTKVYARDVGLLVDNELKLESYQ